MKFIIMVWLAFFARHNPVSTTANPACMNMTRNPVMSVQTKLIAILFCPIWFNTSPTTRPLALGVLSVMGSATAISDTLPVVSPLGSPFALTLGSAAATAFRSASVIGVEAAAGVAAAGGVAGAGVAAGGCWPHARDVSTQAAIKNNEVFLIEP